MPSPCSPLSACSTRKPSKRACRAGRARGPGRPRPSKSAGGRGAIHCARRYHRLAVAVNCAAAPAGSRLVARSRSGGRRAEWRSPRSRRRPARSRPRRGRGAPRRCASPARARCPSRALLRLLLRRGRSARRRARCSSASMPGPRSRTIEAQPRAPARVDADRDSARRRVLDGVVEQVDDREHASRARRSARAAGRSRCCSSTAIPSRSAR